MWPWPWAAKLTNHTLSTNNVPAKDSAVQKMCNGQMFISRIELYETWDREVGQFRRCDTNGQLWGFKPCDLNFEHGNPKICMVINLLMKHKYIKSCCKDFLSSDGIQTNILWRSEPCDFDLVDSKPDSSQISLYGNNRTAYKVWCEQVQYFIKYGTIITATLVLKMAIQNSQLMLWFCLQWCTNIPFGYNTSADMGQTLYYVEE